LESKRVTEHDPEEAVTVAVAARRLGCDPSTVRKLLNRGELTGHRVGSGLEPRGIRVHAESIRAYKHRHAIGTGEVPESAPVHRRSVRDLVLERTMTKELEELGVSPRSDAGAAVRRLPRRAVTDIETLRWLRKRGIVD
jgi:excisionase family DNA binding protein